MKISASELKAVIKQRLNDSDLHLSLRIRSLLSDFAMIELSEADAESDLFILLVQLILCADTNPAHTIAELLVGMEEEAISLVERFTISNAASFVRDYLLRDDVLRSLREYEARENINS